MADAGAAAAGTRDRLGQRGLSVFMEPGDWLEGILQQAEAVALVALHRELVSL
jgi:hypothetical protein